MGSVTGSLTNIQLNGASSIDVHGDPSKLIHDYYNADYGMSFHGLASLHSGFAGQNGGVGVECGVHFCTIHCLSTTYGSSRYLH